jgi:tRNA isopentenyl-2-thiomethyl-A-37 hydroxylase MiaE
MFEVAPAPARAPLPWLLLLVVLALAAGAGAAGARSLHALSTRHAQAEREAAESEARLVEQLALRESLVRRMKALEEESLRLTRERDALQAQLQARPTGTPAKSAAKAVQRKRAAAAQKARGAKVPRGATAAR